MTNHYIDFRNADVILIMGSNAAENHPISFKWVTKAMERGAKLIHVDPRFTRTSSKADIYAPIRSGTDIAFLGGMINYVINDMEKNPSNYNMDYVKQYTNAALIVNSAYKFNDGLFGEIDAKGKYTATAKATWKYADTTTPATDLTLQDPNCAFQLLKKHYSRYDADAVCNITGTPKDLFLEVCRTFASTGKKDKAGTILYAMGITQHTYGTQNIRAFSILQLLLGNMGIAGGGINALRGTSNVQGSTDQALLANYLPGYLAVPREGDTNLDAYLERARPAKVTPVGLAADTSVNWWGNYKKYIVSLLKSWYGDAATADNDFAFGYLPKVDPAVNYTHVGLIDAIANGTIKGLWIWGQNPASGGPNSNAVRTALANLEWMVSTDIWMNETAEFWRRPGVNSANINTEIFLLPMAASIEKEGSISNSGRWVQWRYKAVDPPGEAIPDLEVMNLVMEKIKELYKNDSQPQAKQINAVAWNYGEHISSDLIAKEMNGFDLATGKLMAAFSALKDDGTTSCGNWLHCNSYGYDASGKELNRLQRRDNVDNHPNKIGQYGNWAWCWPVNRRIIYNRAAVDLDGKPWDSEHPVVTFNPANNTWIGDVIDGGGNAINLAAAGAKNLPFIMNAEGTGRLWGFGLVDGPLPEQYEPWESPLTKNPMSGTMNNPPAYVGTYNNPRGTANQFPIVGTTYRCTEHWQTGIMTRNLPWLVEMMPEMYVELSEELAAEKGINNGEKVVVTSSRGEVNAVAIVTKRFQPLTVDGKTVHEIGVPWHWGYSGMSKGDSGNILTPQVGDANTSIPEFKAFLCNIRRA
jgi:formate dehydrogenase-N alpha subunit